MENDRIILAPVDFNYVVNITQLTGSGRQLGVSAQHPTTKLLVVKVSFL